MTVGLIEDVGIVLHQKPFFEKDRLIKVFCKTRGKIQVLAKGALSIRSKKAQVLQVFSYVSFILKPSISGFVYVQDCDLLEDFSGIRKQYQWIQEASFFVRVLQESVMEGQKNEALFNWLYAVLRCLDRDAYNECIQKKVFMEFLKAEGIQFSEPHTKLTKAAFIQIVETYSQRSLHL